MRITPSILYDYLQCPHKPWRDRFGPKEEEVAEDNPFVKLLWEKGVQHEKDVIAGFAYEYEDISQGTIEDRLQRTKQALLDKKKYIYQGVIQHGDLFGIPDLLHLNETDSYVPLDIKSGSGYAGVDEETGDEGKPKKHYAVQLCLYSDILNKMGLSKERKGYIIDNNKEQVEYDLTAPMGARQPQSYWDFYEEIKEKVSDLIQNNTQNSPAMSGVCKLCSWHDSCKNWCVNTNDMTQLFYVGRKVRDTLIKDVGISSVKSLLDISPDELLLKKKGNKEFLKGIGESTLKAAAKRARIFDEKLPPVLYSKISLPEVSYELFFDIEDDPTREFVYLHGIYVRTEESAGFKYFVAKDSSRNAEREAWAGFWSYVNSLPADDFAVYYYSHHEKTTYKKLQKKYPDVISPEEVETFFANPNVIDLYQTVLKNTDWPVGSYGLKALATYLGFKWRDETPSGALSIQWFNEYLLDYDPKKLNRILLYNEDDCIATMVLKDKLAEMNAL